MMADKPAVGLPGSACGVANSTVGRDLSQPSFADALVSGCGKGGGFLERIDKAFDWGQWRRDFPQKWRRKIPQSILTEELTIRENRRVRMAVQMARLRRSRKLGKFQMSQVGRIAPPLTTGRLSAAGDVQDPACSTAAYAHGSGGGEAVRDRPSFRRFCVLPLEADTPDHASIWRFRQMIQARPFGGAAFGDEPATRRAWPHRQARDACGRDADRGCKSIRPMAGAESTRAIRTAHHDIRRALAVHLMVEDSRFLGVARSPSCLTRQAATWFLFASISGRRKKTRSPGNNSSAFTD
jgi:hypothetical protein